VCVWQYDVLGFPIAWVVYMFVYGDLLGETTGVKFPVSFIRKDVLCCTREEAVGSSCPCEWKDRNVDIQ
jgi:hypothetical protein